jgi:hypothetical protein
MFLKAVLPPRSRARTERRIDRAARAVVSKLPYMSSLLARVTPHAQGDMSRSEATLSCMYSSCSRWREALSLSSAGPGKSMALWFPATGQGG